jgi:putative ABC transport system substrate-binding protein
MKRRDFIALAGGAAVALPLVARAQLGDRMRRIGVLIPATEDDPQQQRRVAGFLQGLQQSGWMVGRDVQIEYRWSGAAPDDVRRNAVELVGLGPDVIFATGNSAVAPLLQVTHTVPVVFATVPDPVGAGFVDSLSRPGGNATGFILFEYSIGAKWIELLKQTAPWLTRVAVIRDAAIAAGAGQFGAIQAAAPSLGLEVKPINLRDAVEIERDITAFARSSNGGLILTGSGFAVVHRDLIIRLAALHKLPAVYYERYFVTAGGLISYGPDLVDQFRRAATYVDRILKGEKASDLPVQAPTKYEIAINLKAAKTLGLTFPQSLLAIADEVID